MKEQACLDSDRRERDLVESTPNLDYSLVIYRRRDCFRDSSSSRGAEAEEIFRQGGRAFCPGTSEQDVGVEFQSLLCND